MEFITEIERCVALAAERPEIFATKIRRTQRKFFVLFFLTQDHKVEKELGSINPAEIGRGSFFSALLCFSSKPTDKCNIRYDLNLVP